MYYLFVQLDGIESWLEVSDDGYAERQVDKKPGGRILISSICDTLAEGNIRVEVDEWTTHISKKEFEQVWADAKKPYQPIWEKAEQLFHIGQKLSVSVLAFYPQGI
ncbi:hypothetical protein [Listeria costaricensis]|uniref:hypothetical protein n=1 Tax=Listeria costaricensis TaxID=2026604 RepID=UPI000C06BB62|nr:hypothetical protein [Listeria costaricensis]